MPGCVIAHHSRLRVLLLNERRTGKKARAMNHA
jgi:hypothetical protein